MINSLTERMSILIDEKGISKLENSNVLIAGVGGVGSFAVEAIARAGIGNITIIDSDVVDKSNINRQLVALHSNIGLDKVDIMKQRIKDINPNCNITSLNIFLTPDNIDEILTAQKYDYVIDAIDTLNSKVNLVKKAHDLGINVISSMGAGGKVDPTKIQIADISKTHECKLAKAMRIRLKRQGIKKGITTVFSTEHGIQPLPPKENNENENFRQRATNGTISYMPSIFGLMVAGIVIKDIANKYLKS